MAGDVRIWTVVHLINFVRADSVVFQIRHNAKPQNVMGKFKKRHNRMTQTREPPKYKFDSS